MTLPAWQATGTGSETAPAWPTHAAGHFGLLYVSTATGTVTTPAGWTLVVSCDNAAASVSLFVFYRRATSSSETAPSLAGGSSYLWGQVITYTGVHSDTPIHCQTVGWTVSNTGWQVPGLKTFLDDCVVAMGVSWGSDNAGPLSSGEANANLGSLTERADSGTTTGNGGGLVLLDGTLATQNTIQPTAGTFSVSTAGCAAAFALQAADKTLPTLGRRTRIVNTGM